MNPFGSYEEAWKGIAGKPPKMWNTPQAMGPTTPFLMAMFNPFVQSFQNAGFDPYGGQVREAMAPEPEKKFVRRPPPGPQTQEQAMEMARLRAQYDKLRNSNSGWYDPTDSKAMEAAAAREFQAAEIAKQMRELNGY